MSVEDDLYTTLTGAAGVAALVGSKVYPGVIPQNTALPAVVYTMFYGGRVATLAGDTGGRNPQFQVDSWATTYEGAKALNEAVHTALAGAVAFKSTPLGDRDDADPDEKLYRVIAEFSIW